MAAKSGLATNKHEKTMPELPEVETAARTLAPQLAGRRIIAIERLDWERMIETPSVEAFYAALPGSTVLAVSRRAKWLLLTLDESTLR